MKKVLTSDIGNATKYPAIQSLTDIFNEQIELSTINKAELNYCKTTIQELRCILITISALNMPITKYLLILVRRDFMNRVDNSKINGNTESHLRNIISGMCNNEIENVTT